MRRMTIGMSIVDWLAALSALGVQAGQAPPPRGVGWVKLPAAGAPRPTPTWRSRIRACTHLSAHRFVGLAGSIEIRQTGKDAALEEVTVPANGWLDMDAKGVHLLLKDLKKPLAEGDKVSLTLVTELGVKVQVDAVVKKE